MNKPASSAALRDRLVRYLRHMPPALKERLASLKGEATAHRLRADFLWYFLITSFSTLGNSRGYYGLLADPQGRDSISFAALSGLTHHARQSLIDAVFRKARVRMPTQKARWLADNWNIIDEMGGLAEANATAFLQPGRSAKIAFLKRFHGIGDKYARHIWMTVYDPDFRECIAIDSRITKVSDRLGLKFVRYVEHEAFYQTVAAEAGLEPWEVDRALYWDNDSALAALDQTS